MKALIIQGPQGSGKSTIARAVAGMLGTLTTVVDVEAFRSPFDIGYALKDSPHTLIVEGIDVSNPNHLEFLKVMATPGKIEVNQKMKPVSYIDAPNLIAVSNSADLIKLPSTDRRFVVLDTTNFSRDANQIHVTGSSKPEDFDKLLASIKPGAVTSISPVPEPIRPVLLSAINELGKEAGVTGVPITVEDIIGSSLGEMLLVEVLREATLRQTRLSEGYERLRSVAVRAAEAMSQCLCDTGDEFSTRCDAAYQLTQLNREIAVGLADRPAAKIPFSEMNAATSKAPTPKSSKPLRDAAVDTVQLVGKLIRNKGVTMQQVQCQIDTLWRAIYYDQDAEQIQHTPAPSSCPEGYEMRSKHSYQEFVDKGWTDSQLINVGYMQQLSKQVVDARAQLDKIQIGMKKLQGMLK
jgi:energy-coupling factor transporter ATP-binding protein EcfA2